MQTKIQRAGKKRKPKIPNRGKWNSLQPEAQRQFSQPIIEFLHLMHTYALSFSLYFKQKHVRFIIKAIGCDQIKLVALKSIGIVVYRSHVSFSMFFFVFFCFLTLFLLWLVLLLLLVVFGTCRCCSMIDGTCWHYIVSSEWVGENEWMSKKRKLKSGLDRLENHL